MRRSQARLEQLSARGLDVPALRAEALAVLRSAMSIDAAFFATVDPATLLFTWAAADEPLDVAREAFLANEFAGADVNTFVGLAEGFDHVGSLDAGTGHRRRASARYRDVLAPLGLGDEARVALVSGDRCWGVLCLHREEATAGFTEAELDFLRRIGPVLGDGLRRSAALVTPAPEEDDPARPGVLVLGPDLAIRSASGSARRWLEELSATGTSPASGLPPAVEAAATRVLAGASDGRDDAATTRVARPGGGWVAVHAAAMEGGHERQVAVVLEPAHPADVSSLVLAAHGLTPAQSRVVALVLRGYSTRAIVRELRISPYTVQEHLRAVFDRLGIGSRRELVATLSGHPR
jgi:DNA-binding CsgD family transcriptional regulator